MKNKDSSLKEILEKKKKKNEQGIKEKNEN